ncbi:molybdate ABC transporter substrate-binding protein [Raineyella fluvialis]|uniref:Molybdate ABC transporter substrate-binding protein n=1 Tax=Raineyella fluvialis TaxID=2662261 RepID=A0A5Q2FH58_9ACTN|nr:molybdate ABC transporter substrate-binding protein [Raineyella fluvialis]QGF23656.1 molybdate ABC transporter substrate-binding protein [Raineyella fluvialis]
MTVPRADRPAVGPSRHWRVSATARLLVTAIMAIVGLSACGSPAPSAGQAASGAGQSSTSATTLTVFAAASLAGPFDQIATAFSAAHPGVTVRYSYGGSSDLVSQLAAGAPADVLATADERTMQQAKDQGLVPQSTLFATNQLAILVAKGNPLGIVGARDLSHPALKLVTCAPQVPCGAATDRTLKAAGISVSPVSEEANVTDTAGKVTSGQADAAVVYTTDVAKAEAAGKGTGIPLGIDQTPNRYPLGVTTSGAKGSAAAAAQDYVAYVTGPDGQAILARAGFGRP